MLDHGTGMTSPNSLTEPVCSGSSESVAAVWASWKIGCGFARGVKGFRASGLPPLVIVALGLGTGQLLPGIFYWDGEELARLL